MKFYSDIKNQVVWDPFKNKILCKFVNGEFETDNNDIIKILIKTFKHDEIHKKGGKSNAK